MWLDSNANYSEEESRPRRISYKKLLRVFSQLKNIEKLFCMFFNSFFFVENIFCMFFNSLARMNDHKLLVSVVVETVGLPYTTVLHIHHANLIQAIAEPP